MSSRVAPYFAGLDGLRIFAALSVLSYHVMGRNAWADVPTSGPLAWIRCGWVGVDVFFAISGLVVGQSALARFRREGTAFRSAFARQRWARIAPLYLLTGLACWLLLPPRPVGVDALFQLAAHLAFLHNLWPATIVSINPPSWSLAVEMQLYALLMLATPWLARQGALRVAAASVAIALAYRVAAYALLRAAGVDDSGLWAHAIAQTPGLLDSFGLGVAASIALARPQPPRPGAAACLLLMAVGLSVLLLLGLETSRRMLAQALWNEPVYALVMRSGVALGAASLAFGCALLPLRSGTRSTAVLRLGGHLSYGVYLWHFLVFTELGRVDGLGAWGLLAAVTAATLLLSWCTWIALERPVLRHVQREA